MATPLFRIGDIVKIDNKDNAYIIGIDIQARLDGGSFLYKLKYVIGNNVEIDVEEGRLSPTIILSSLESTRNVTNRHSSSSNNQISPTSNNNVLHPHHLSSISSPPNPTSSSSSSSPSSPSHPITCNVRGTLIKYYTMSSSNPSKSLKNGTNGIRPLVLYTISYRITSPKIKDG